MSNIQESITSILQERNARKHLTVVVCIFAVFAALNVFWLLHLNGITLTSGDLICEMKEHTHTSDCYDWVVLEEDTDTETEDTDTETETTVAETAEAEKTATEAAKAETGTTVAEETKTTVTENTGIETTVTAESADIESTETETGTEEDTESPQLGDTKVVDGVTYVYTLICELEEHTHTDECYASEDEDADAAEETDTDNGELELTGGVAQIGTYGASAASLDDESDIATASDDGTSSEDEESSESTESLTSSASEGTYYFADNVTLDTAESNLDGKYFIYTVDADGNYYLVKSDGSLVKCGDLSSLNTDDSKASDSTVGGAYYWGVNSDSKDVFKITSLDSFDVSDYLWTLGSESAGYTLYNSASGNYLAPEQTVSESLDGNLETTYTWKTTKQGKDYTMASDEVLVLTVECTADVNDTAIFNLELYDTTPITVNSTQVTQYITTWSDGREGWFALPLTTDPASYADLSYYSGILTSPTSTATMAKGDVCTIIVSRTEAVSGISGYTDYTIAYYDTNGNERFTYTATDTQMSSNNVNAHVIAQVGSFDVSVAYATPVTKTNTIDADCTELVIGTETSEVKDTAVLDAETYRTGEQELTGDFDITYTFKNTNTSRNKAIDRDYLDWNYVLVFETADNSHVYLYASGDRTGVSKTTTITYGDGDSFAAIQNSSSSTWTRYASTMPQWLIWMNWGTDCTINITREGSVITVSETIKYSGDVISTCVTTFTCSDDITVFLSGVGNTCTLSGISLKDNTPNYEIYAYDAYAPVSDEAKVLTLTASDTDGWTALTTAYTTDNYENLDLTQDSYSTVSWTNETTGETYYLALLREYYAWFDGTNGGMSSYSVNETYNEVITASVDAAGNVQSITAPTVNETTDGSGYQNYTLRGWYDIYNGAYYKPEAEITLDMPTVFYADWEVTTYEIGQNADVASNTSTSSFITTNVFDYNELFNAQSNTISEPETRSVYSGVSSSYLSTLTATSHSESFTISSSTSIADPLSSLSFIFFRSESSLLIDFPDGRTSVRGNASSNSGTTQKLLGSTGYGIKASTNSLLQALFGTGNTVDDVDDPDSDSFVLGKTYVGTGDYLFQYDEDSGYYYYDSYKNAASYNSEDNRFYVYNYKVYANLTGSSKSTDDFLPFNYASSNTGIDEKAINYWFGMSTEIEFYLSDDVPKADSDDYGNVNLASVTSSNESEKNHMTFKFSGDDDVWVFIDDMLVLDLGGVHGQVYGEIDFSTGEVYVVNTMSGTDSSGNTVTYVEYDSREIIDYTAAAVSTGAAQKQTEAESIVRTLKEGTHTLTFYYLERGASQSNAAIYFNISSETYNLELTKWAEELDADQEELKGAVFSYYTSADFNEDSLVTLEDENGNEKTEYEAGEIACGLRVGRTYYVKEVSTPEGYSDNGRYLTVYLDSNGVLTVTVYVTGSDTAIEAYTYTMTKTTTEEGTTYTSAWKSSADNSATNTTGWSYVYDADGTANVSTYVYMSYTEMKDGVAGSYDIGLIIQNTKEYELPSAGSTGTRTYLFAGEVLVLFAGMGIIMIAFYQFVRVQRFGTNKNIKEHTEEKTGNGKRSIRRTRDHPRERSITRGHARDRPGDR